MLNYDPKFQEIAQEGDILVGGWNFGSGSSREQAATALKYRGHPAHHRRLILADLQAQRLQQRLHRPRVPEARHRSARPLTTGRPEPTIRTDWKARVDFESSEITVEGKTYPFAPLRDVAQELVALGGFEAVLAQRLS